MTPETTETQENERSQKARTLGLVLVAFSLVMASLICCGQVALLLGSSSRTIDTISLLKADYSPWGYEKVGAINLAGYKEDIQRDQELGGVVVAVPGDNVEPGVFWPTGIPTPIPVAALTATAPQTPTEPIALATDIPASTAAPTPTHTVTGTRLPATATQTSTPTATASPSFTPVPPTRTFTFVPQPTHTQTNAPVVPSNTPVPPTATAAPTRTNTALPATPTRTPTRTNTAPPPTSTQPPTSTNTAVVPPTATFTPIPAHTNTPVATTPPFYVAVQPIAENEAISDPDPENPAGCMGYFGYNNANAYPVSIPAGGSNYLTQNAYYVYTLDPGPTAGLPNQFYTLRWSGVVQVKWDTGAPITWVLDGGSATLGWCR